METNLLVDYLTISFKLYSGQAECFSKWLYRRINFPVFDALKIKSFLGFPDCLYYQGIRIHSGDNMIVLDMSGKGCRTVEQLNKGWDWYGFFHSFHNGLTKPMKDSKSQYQVHISRIDVACDRLGDEKITFNFLLDYVLKLKWICKSTYYTPMLGNRINEYLFGSPESKRILRIYDKAMEQKITDGTKWLRFEFQLRDDCATAFYLNLCENAGNFVKVYYGMLHEYLRFITKPNDGTHSDRKVTCRWWLDFLHDVERMKQLYLPGDEYDLSRITHFYSKGCASTVRTLIEAAGGDVTELIKTAENTPMNKRQREALDKYNRKNRAQDEADRIESELAYKGTAAILEILEYHQKKSDSELRKATMEKLSDKYVEKIHKTLYEGHGELSESQQTFVYQLRAEKDRNKRIQKEMEHAIEHGEDIPFYSPDEEGNYK